MTKNTNFTAYRLSRFFVITCYHHNTYSGSSAIFNCFAYFFSGRILS